jgi:hypothetical protein
MARDDGRGYGLSDRAVDDLSFNATPPDLKAWPMLSALSVSSFSATAKAAA